MDDLDLRIARLDVRDGDTLVIKTGQPLADEIGRRISEHVKANLPSGINVLIVDASVEFSVIRKEAADG